MALLQKASSGRMEKGSSIWMPTWSLCAGDMSHVTCHKDFGPRPDRALGANAIVVKKSDANIRLDYLGRFAVCSLDKL